ncbi:hypothetical protein FGO68_gene12639 [Halteria grandinella]|uniref:Piwi domain-containing protein n=1 Tax=Halteria grandinella TaxID=5974 RepID=A0A8J8T6Q4_HALGN|nr:hypothetical protein FGO68_gene12639 [Halteria grandinella]
MSSAQNDFYSILIRESMQQQGYRAIGRRGLSQGVSYFHTRDRRYLGSDIDMSIWTGYQIKIQRMMVCIDTKNKLLHGDTVWAEIKLLQRSGLSPDEISRQLLNQMSDEETASSLQVITTYNTAQYTIYSIDFDSTPVSKTFLYTERNPLNGRITKSLLSLSDYLLKRYSIQLTPEECKQPLLTAYVNQQVVYLLPSRCLRVGLGLGKDFTKENRDKISQIREHMCLNPEDRYSKVKTLAKLLNNDNFGIETKQMKVVAKQLPVPRLIDGEGCVRTWKEYECKKLKHNQAAKLEKGNWAMVYAEEDFDKANTLADMFQKASLALGMLIQEPQWVEISTSSLQSYLSLIQSDINPLNCQLVIVIINDSGLKPTLKSLLDRGGIPSQFIQSQTITKDLSLGVYSNLLKQINAKMGLDLYRIEYGTRLRNTMLIGIDIVNSGSFRLIGCSATMDEGFGQCFSKVYKQMAQGVKTDEAVEGVIKQKVRRGLMEERIGKERAQIIGGFVREAMARYKERNGVMPEQVMVYRDGTGGQGLKQQIEAVEVETVQEIVGCKVLYCLVDKNINERFFTKSNSQGIGNPIAGTVIDTDLVERDGDRLFDFFMIPHKAMVATAMPVLYQIIQNTSGLTKEEIEIVTYHLCYNYFNFPGPIKVPMVCMYAHKIAQYALEYRIIPNEALSGHLHFL